MRERLQDLIKIGIETEALISIKNYSMFLDAVTYCYNEGLDFQILLTRPITSNVEKFQSLLYDVPGAMFRFSNDEVSLDYNLLKYQDLKELQQAVDKIYKFYKQFNPIEDKNAIFDYKTKHSIVNDTTTACVFHLIHTKTPFRYIPKLFILNVPQNTTEKDLKNQLEKAGFKFGEFGIPWANHYVIIGLENAPMEVKKGWHYNEAECISFGELKLFQKDLEKK